MLLFIVIFSCFINPTNTNKNITKKLISRNRKSNIIIALVGVIFLYLILGVGIISLSKNFQLGTYTYIETTIYEYSIVIFVLTYFFAKKFKIINLLLFLYAVLFTVSFTIFGDRSSSFLYIIILLLLMFPHYLTFRNTIFFGISGIILSNLISIIRGAGSNLSFSYVFHQIIAKGLYQDTVSWAYYGGLSGIAVHETKQYGLNILFGFVKGIFGLKDEFSDVIGFSKTYYYYNAGGGILPQHLYSFAGWSGVIFGEIITGIVLNKLLNSNRSNFILIIISLVTAFCVRWYIILL
ncbi:MULTISPECIES: hypothetical protein [unclassified Facklamia]|uniref:hypothetical protein n=1 Tax=Aerococcaceae TaxID=186827 RepID=UPI0013BB6AA0|nr:MULTISPECIES: hypothetical protein [unclassified Facklamia]MBS4462466.1 hypothetical protein [Aerococcaceae bacterium zg-B36]NEW65053.1 hypothetical protein [Facklamia sp. 252]NEW68710.1 hypothetical protein [Facklamia sp. 253]QQD65118.1 hypothetical protein JDW14_07325 [Aerococcaceae bacterium zg-252]